MKKFVRGLVLFIILVIALALIFNKQISYYLIDRTGKDYQVSKLTKEEAEKNNRKKETFNFEQVEPIDSKAVAKSQLASQKNDLPVIAGIAVPDVGINLPIFKGVSNENLLYGAGTLSPEQKMGKGNYALASHRMNDPESLFTPLEKVSLGDKIYLTDLSKVYVYQTTSKKKVHYTDASSLEKHPKKPIVTLITCAEMDSPIRIVVQGELVATKAIEETSVFEMAENR